MYASYFLSNDSVITPKANSSITFLLYHSKNAILPPCF